MPRDYRPSIVRLLFCAKGDVNSVKINNIRGRLRVVRVESVNKFTHLMISVIRILKYVKTGPARRHGTR